MSGTMQPDVPRPEGNGPSQEDEFDLVDITPDPSLLPKLGHAGYSVIEALSELIDNSIDARLVGSPLRIYIEMSEGTISIRDNARGMSSEELGKAMTLGLSTKEGMLGSFGLGLKTACTSLGKRFEILTRPLDGEVIYRLVFDEDEWGKTGKWTEYKIDRLIGRGLDEHGTKITVSKLRVWYGNLVTIAKREFGQRYYPFLEGGDVEIFVNLRACDPAPPQTLWKEPFELRTRRGDLIKGWVGAKKVETKRARKGQGQEYGFNLYRNGRLVKAYEAVGFNRHPELRRLVGEIHLDALPVTHNKREFIKTDPEYVAFVEQFKAFLDEKGYKTRIRDLAGAPEDGPAQVRRRLNKKLERIPALITLISGAKETEPDLVLSTDRGPLAVDVKFQRLGQREGIKRAEEIENGLRILVNTDHLLYATARDKELIALYSLAEILAQHFVANKSYSEVATLRDAILSGLYASEQPSVDETQAFERLRQDLLSALRPHPKPAQGEGQ